MNGPKESDWKVYKKILPVVTGRFLDIKLQHIAAYLQDLEIDSETRFWETKKKFKEIEKILDSYSYYSRSKMYMNLAIMKRHNILQKEDLEKFSPELQESLKDF